MTLGRSGNASYFWDGRRSTLEAATLDPFTNPVEMGLADGSDLITKLRSTASYQPLLKSVFHNETHSIALPQIANALSTYIRTLDVRISAFDHFAVEHDKHALSAQVQRGLALFEGKGHCAECHVTHGDPPPLTDNAYHRTGIGMNDIENNLPQLTMAVMKRPIKDEALGSHIAMHSDEAQLGRFNVTHQVEDIGLFRTPSLRGVGQTAPYMHDGSVATLPDALEMEIYYRSLSSGYPIGLTVQEKDDLLEFLRQL
jgi:cytochrome c peroxidase